MIYVHCLLHITVWRLKYSGEQYRIVQVNTRKYPRSNKTEQVAASFQVVLPLKQTEEGGEQAGVESERGEVLGTIIAPSTLL